MPEPINKKWYQSKIVWFNVFSIIALIVQYFIDNKMFPAYVAYETLAIIVVNAILRLFFTDTNLTK